MKLFYAFLMMILAVVVFGDAPEPLLEKPFFGTACHCQSTKGARVTSPSRGEWLFQPGDESEQCVIAIAAEPGIVCGYDYLELTISNENESAAVEATLEASSPKNGRVGRRLFSLESGTKRYLLPLEGVGHPIQLHQILLTVRHTPQAARRQPKSIVTKPLAFRSIRLLATRESLKLLEAKLEQHLTAPLPDGLSETATQAATLRRSQLRESANQALRLLRQSNTDNRHNALERLYALANTCVWEIQKAALRADTAPDRTIYGWTGGADKILRNGPFPGRIGGIVKVSLARNEAESAQIALFSAQRLKEVSVSLSTFKSKEGHVLTSATATPVGYITTQPPAYFSEYAPYAIPDPLLSYLKAFEVEPETFQSIWLDFHASRHQSPGIYRGTVTLTQQDKTLLSVPVEITVRHFELPDKMTFPSVVSSGIFHSPLYESSAAAHQEFENYMFDENGGDPSRLSSEAQHLVQINDGLFQLLNEHHITFQDIYRSTRRVIPGWRRRQINQFNSMFCLGYDNDRNVMANFERQFPAMRQEGTAQRAFLYGNDEIRTSDKRAFERMKESYGSLKKAFPELKTMATALDYSYGEQTNTTEEVDIWVVPPGSYMSGRAAAERARKRGKQVWYYPCNWPYPPDANLLLESRATATRLLPGFMAWQCKVDGFLYYSAGMLARQVKTNSLLGKWETKGGAEIVTLAPWDFENTYRLHNPRDAKEQHAQISRWTMLPKNLDKPLVAEFEALPEAGNAPELHVELRINYNDGTTDSTILALPPNAKDWTKVSKQVKLTGPIRNILYALRLDSPDSSVQLKNIRLYQEGELFDRRLSADKIVTGGPLLGEEYCYSMFRSNGDGTLYYPGPDGVLPCIRLKFLRDGLEDYEYLVLLRKAAEEVRAGRKAVSDAKSWLSTAEQLMKVPENVCKSLSHYALTGDVLLDYRDQIASLLEQVQ